jgi:hypothetical protein
MTKRLMLAKADLKAINMTINWMSTFKEYRVNFEDGTPVTAYYTEDLDDALDTARHMARERRISRQRAFNQ